MPHIPASSVLDDITVLDLTRVRSGPTATRQLGDWGANVIKIEIPETGNQQDHLSKKRDGSDFMNLHRNKRSLTLNLKSPEGLRVFKKICSIADVVVENYRPGVKMRLGIDYEKLSKINPRLIYASISGFGQSGPERDRPGFDQILQGVGGLMSLTGIPGQGPVRVGIPVADLSAGLFCAIGILLALLERQRSGRGQWLHTSLLEAMVFMLDFQASRWLVEKEIPKQSGNNHPTSIPTGVFETSDGLINIAVVGKEMWERFCNVLEAPNLLENPNYADNELRSNNRNALNREINRIIRTRTSAGWIRLLNQSGVPCGKIHNVREVFEEPQVKHLGLAEQVEEAGKRKLELIAQPVTLERTPSCLKTQPPGRGQHSCEILREFGFSLDEIRRLQSEKVI